MKVKSEEKSLKRLVQRLSIRWTLIGFMLTLLLSLFFLMHSVKSASERQLSMTANAAARAFRPMILQGDIRSAQYQLKQALALKNGEWAVVRDLKKTAIYPLVDIEKEARCSEPLKPCWNGWSSVSLLTPIFFDDEIKENLFGFLELTLAPTLDFFALFWIGIFSLTVFCIQAFGLSSALSQIVATISKQLNDWSKHLKNSPQNPILHPNAVPFDEMKSMQDAVNDLHLEIERLTAKTASEAKAQAQLSLLREIGHDLKTPHSQLAKFIALHLDTVQKTGRVDQEEVDRIERSIKRMGEIIRLVRAVEPLQLRRSYPSQNERCDVVAETRTYIADLMQDAEVISKKLTIHFNAEDFKNHARISTVSYYRLLENLVRNAIHVLQKNGNIWIKLSFQQKHIQLAVIDDGPGIPEELENRIFDFDFTTKPSRGTGLGLGIVRQICKEWNAKLDLHSEPGQETRFEIQFQVMNSLPLHQVEVKENVLL